MTIEAMDQKNKRKKHVKGSRFWQHRYLINFNSEYALIILNYHEPRPLWQGFFMLEIPADSSKNDE